ncbi:MAG: hypothetical protein ACI4XS_00285 [Bacillus sp. (in: firmicutes)]
MGNKKARYKVGDTVVIKKYGTVGKITDIKCAFLLVQNLVCERDIV